MQENTYIEPKVQHHKDENKQNNAIENLGLMTDSEHKSYHARKRNGLKFKKCCIDKGKLIEDYKVGGDIIVNGKCVLGENEQKGR